MQSSESEFLNLPLIDLDRRVGGFRRKCFKRIHVPEFRGELLRPNSFATLGENQDSPPFDQLLSGGNRLDRLVKSEIQRETSGACDHQVRWCIGASVCCKHVSSRKRTLFMRHPRISGKDAGDLPVAGECDIQDEIVLSHPRNLEQFRMEWVTRNYAPRTTKAPASAVPHA